MTALKPGTPVVVGDLVIEPVERIVVTVEQVAGAIVAVARKEPVSVVIRTPAGSWTVDLERLSDYGLPSLTTGP